MKKFLAPFSAVVAFLVVLVACSAAQKQAESDLAKDTAKQGTECVTACGVRKAIQGNLGDPAKAAGECASECGIDLVTNPNVIQDVVRIMAGAQAGVVAAAKTVDAGPDAGH